MSDLTRVRPFDRQPDEGGTSWEGFCAYRDAGPQRTIASVSQAIGIPLSTLKSAASSWHWVSRAEAFDRFVDSQRIDAVADDVRARAHAQRRILNVLAAVTVREAERLLADCRAGHGCLRPKEILIAAELVIKLSRLLDGEVDHRIEVSTVDYSRLDDAQLQFLAEIAQVVQ